MSICTSCQSEISEAASFCTTCGTQRNAEPVAQVAETASTPEPESLVITPSKRRLIRAGIGAVAVVALLFVGAGLTKAGAMDWLVGETFTKDQMQKEYDRGNTAGKKSGYDDGYSAGSSEGYSTGYTSGKSAGCRAVFEKVRTDSGYGAIVAWDTIWNRSRGSYYYQASSTCP